MVAWFVADEAHLANIAVAPLARRRGLAQRLLDELVAESVRREARMVLLEVRRSNHAAQAFYRKNGFYLAGVRHRYYRDNGEDALIMVKPLNESGRLPALEEHSQWPD
jgi:ribosomal-protein-alanine N-acetyltransferase